MINDEEKIDEKIEKQKWDFNFLQKFVEEYGITLLKDYSKEKVNSKIFIEGYCINENCNNTFKKKMINLINTKNGGCSACSKFIGAKKAGETSMKLYGVKSTILLKQVREALNEVRDSYDNNLLNEFVKENNLILQKDYTNEKVNRETIIICSCITIGCNGICERPFRSLVSNKNFGCEICKTKFTNEKAIKTNMEKYGAKNHKNMTVSFDYEYLQRFIKENNLTIFGNYLDVKITTNIIGNCIKENCCNKFEKPFRYLTTHKNFYCFKCAQQIGFVKQKETNMRIFGVIHQSQNAEVAHKQLVNSVKIKKYTLPSGKIINYQGYENFALDELINVENINENDILNDRTVVPVIWYNDKDNIKHRHYVDIYIPNKKLCIEVKSPWTYGEKFRNDVLEKQKAGKELGYFYEIWVYDGKGNKVECLK